LVEKSKKTNEAEQILKRFATEQRSKEGAKWSKYLRKMLCDLEQALIKNKVGQMSIKPLERM
jgi:hypothetical protein